jgi:hypothetical protein
MQLKISLEAEILFNKIIIDANSRPINKYNSADIAMKLAEYFTAYPIQFREGINKFLSLAQSLYTHDAKERIANLYQISNPICNELKTIQPQLQSCINTMYEIHGVVYRIRDKQFKKMTNNLIRFTTNAQQLLTSANEILNSQKQLYEQIPQQDTKSSPDTTIHDVIKILRFLIDLFKNIEINFHPTEEQQFIVLEHYKEILYNLGKYSLNYPSGLFKSLDEAYQEILILFILSGIEERYPSKNNCYYYFATGKESIPMHFNLADCCQESQYDYLMIFNRLAVDNFIFKSLEMSKSPFAIHEAINLYYLAAIAFMKWPNQGIDYKFKAKNAMHHFLKQENEFYKKITNDERLPSYQLALCAEDIFSNDFDILTALAQYYFNKDNDSKGIELLMKARDNFGKSRVNSPPTSICSYVALLVTKSAENQSEGFDIAFQAAEQGDSLYLNHLQDVAESHNEIIEALAMRLGNFALNTKLKIDLDSVHYWLVRARIQTPDNANIPYLRYKLQEIKEEVDLELLISATHLGNEEALAELCSLANDYEIAQAYYHLGLLYIAGEFVVQDYDLAARYLNKALQYLQTNPAVFANFFHTFKNTKFLAYLMNLDNDKSEWIKALNAFNSDLTLKQFDSKDETSSAQTIFFHHQTSTISSKTATIDSMDVNIVNTNLSIQQTK